MRDTGARLAAARRAAGESLLILYERSPRRSSLRGSSRSHRGASRPGRSPTRAKSERGAFVSIRRSGASSLLAPDGIVLTGPCEPDPWRTALLRGPSGPVLVGPCSIGEEVEGAYLAAAEGARSSGRAVYLLDPEPSGLPDEPGAVFTALFVRFPGLETSSGGFEAALARGIPSGWIFPFVPGWTARTDTLEGLVAKAAAAGRASWRRCARRRRPEPAPRVKRRAPRLRRAKRVSSSGFITAHPSRNCRRPGIFSARPARAKAWICFRRAPSGSVSRPPTRRRRRASRRRRRSLPRTSIARHCFTRPRDGRRVGARSGSDRPRGEPAQGLSVRRGPGSRGRRGPERRAMNVLKEEAPADHPITRSPDHPIPSGLYVHLPYCRSRCGYCAFVVSTDESSAGAYRGALARRRRCSPEARGARFDSVYLGGTLLTPAPDLLALLETSAAASTSSPRRRSRWRPIPKTSLRRRRATGSRRESRASPSACSRSRTGSFPPSDGVTTPRAPAAPSKRSCGPASKSRAT